MRIRVSFSSSFVLHGYIVNSQKILAVIYATREHDLLPVGLIAHHRHRHAWARIPFKPEKYWEIHIISDPAPSNISYMLTLSQPRP